MKNNVSYNAELGKALVQDSQGNHLCSHTQGALPAAANANVCIGNALYLPPPPKVVKKPRIFAKPAKEEIDFIPGLWLLYDVNFWTYAYDARHGYSNIEFVTDLYKTPNKVIKHAPVDDRLYTDEGAALIEPPMQELSIAVANKLELSFEQVSTIADLTATPGDVLIVKLFKQSARLTASEFIAIKAFARKGRVIFQCEWSSWLNYDLHVLAGLGLSSKIADLEASSVVYTLYNGTKAVKAVTPTVAKAGGYTMKNNAVMALLTVQDPCLGVYYSPRRTNPKGYSIIYVPPEALSI